MGVLGAIFVLKERELVDIFQTKGVDQDSLVSFLMNFLDRHRFNVTDFEQLNEEFKSVFHVDWNTVLLAERGDCHAPTPANDPRLCAAESRTGGKSSQPRVSPGV